MVVYKFCMLFCITDFWILYLLNGFSDYADYADFFSEPGFTDFQDKISALGFFACFFSEPGFTDFQDKISALGLLA